jgi:hypothetical protein
MGTDAIVFEVIHRPQAQGAFQRSKSPLNFQQLFVAQGDIFG